MDISIIIPTLNAEHEIEALLIALDRQSIQPNEILVVDSASEDNVATQAVLDALAAREISASTLAEAATIAEDNETARGILDERAHLLASIAADLVTEHNPVTVVLAGSAFIDDPHAAKLFASSLRQHNTDAQLRLIPTHREIVRAIARAVALDPLLRVPLSLQPSTASVRS